VCRKVENPLHNLTCWCHLLSFLEIYVVEVESVIQIQNMGSEFKTLPIALVEMPKIPYILLVEMLEIPLIFSVEMRKIPHIILGGDAKILAIVSKPWPQRC
jgi:hypothetical protein